jgi:hypothetical protein
VRQNAHDDLTDHEGDDQRQRDGQAACVLAASVRVIVRMVVHQLKSCMPCEVVLA